MEQLEAKLEELFRSGARQVNLAALLDAMGAERDVDYSKLHAEDCRRNRYETDAQEWDEEVYQAEQALKEALGNL